MLHRAEIGYGRHQGITHGKQSNAPENKYEVIGSRRVTKFIHGNSFMHAIPERNIDI